MKIAILTGASAGLGTEYFKNLIPMQDIDEIWLIARRAERLEEMAASCSKKCRVIPMDLTDKESLSELNKLINNENPDIRVLINNAGFGKLGFVGELSYLEQAKIVELNNASLTAVTAMVIPFMSEGSFILNVCSIASFCPNPRMTVYSSSKAYVLSFSKSLRYELKSKKINVIAVCPGPMSTEFLSVAGITDTNSKIFATLPYSDPKKVAAVSLKKAMEGKAVYTPKLLFKFYRVLAKLVPHNFIMPFSKA